MDIFLSVIGTSNRLYEIINTSSSTDIHTALATAQSTWHHCCITRSGSVGSFYYDGQLSSTNAAATIYFSGSVLSVGRVQCSTTFYYLDGEVTGLFYAPFAITAQQVDELYETGNPSP
jgi:hypothetical protein